MRPAASASRMERSRGPSCDHSTRWLLRAESRTGRAALARAAEVEHLGAVWELDAERRPRARPSSSSARRRETRTPVRWRGRCAAWKDCFDVAGLHTTGRRALACVRRLRCVRARPSSSASRRPGDHARQARDDAAGLGDDGPDARPPERAATPRPCARPGRLLVGLGGRGCDGHRRPRTRHRRRRQRAPSGSAPAASSVSSRPTAPCRWKAACPTRRATTRGGAIARSVAEAALQHAAISRRAASPISPAASTACASRSWAATSPPRSTTTSRPCSSARGSTCARVRSTSRGRGRTTAAMSPIFVAEPGAFVLEHDPISRDPARYDADHRRRRR